MNRIESRWLGITRTRCTSCASYAEWMPMPKSELCRYVDHNSLRNNTTILLVGSKVIKQKLWLLLRSSSSSSSIYYIGSKPGHRPDLLGPRDTMPKELGSNRLIRRLVATRYDREWLLYKARLSSNTAVVTQPLLKRNRCLSGPPVSYLNKNPHK